LCWRNEWGTVLLRIDIDGSTPDRLRFAMSPLWETLSAALLVSRCGDTAPWPYTNWFVSLQSCLDDKDIRGFISWLAEFGSPETMPVPTSALEHISDEVRAVGHTPLRRHLPGLDAFWQTAIAPRWPDMRAALENEVLFRARILATEGARAVLTTLHSRMSWEPPTLSVASALTGHHVLADRTLVLVPLIFGRGQPLFSAGTPDVAALSYQARGAAVLAAERATTDRSDRLAALTGRSRAAVIRAIAAPSTTTVLANRLGLAPSTVSEHLTVLVEAGIARRSRVGIRVLYELDHAGMRILDALDKDLV
jgi:DNA-binding transcriptional ArsR family regulator